MRTPERLGEDVKIYVRYEALPRHPRGSSHELQGKMQTREMPEKCHKKLSEDGDVRYHITCKISDKGLVGDVGRVTRSRSWGGTAKPEPTPNG